MSDNKDREPLAPASGSENPSDPPGYTFYDNRSRRMMRLVSDGEWKGWIIYKHPDGQWVSFRKATDLDWKVLAVAMGSASWSTNPPNGPGYFWSRSYGGRPVIAWYTDSGIRMSCDQTVIVLDSDEGRDWMATQEIEFWSEPIVFAGKSKESPAPGTDFATTCPQCGSLEVRIMKFTECGLSIRMCYCQKCPHQWVEKGKA